MQTNVIALSSGVENNHINTLSPKDIDANDQIYDGN